MRFVECLPSAPCHGRSRVATLRSRSFQAGADVESSSQRWLDAEYVLKLVNVDDSMKRETCLLKRMAGPSVPRLLCHSRRAMIVANAGVPLTVENLPTNYFAQAQAIFADMRARGVEHHDMWKGDDPRGSAHKLEFLVDAHGKMRLVDFAMGSVHGSYACVDGDSRSSAKPMAGPALPFLWDGVRDNASLGVLHSMANAQSALRAYQAAGLPDALIGICNLRAALTAVKAEAECHATSAPCVNALPPADAEHVSATSLPYFEGASLPIEMPSYAWSGMPPVGSSARINARVFDVRECIQRCERSAHCHAVSVSSVRRQCLAFNSACALSRGKAVTLLQDDPDQPGEGRPLTLLSRLADFSFLDDFTTVDVQRMRTRLEKERATSFSEHWRKLHISIRVGIVSVFVCFLASLLAGCAMRG